MRFRLRQREHRFVDQFVELAGHLVSGARLLAELLGSDQPAREAIAQRMREEDQAVEAATHGVLRSLAGAFVTPVDRVDVYRLAWALRSCSREIDAVIDQVALLRLGELPKAVTDQVHLISRSADLTLGAMPRVTRMRAMSAVWVELTRLNKESGLVHRRLVAEVASTARDFQGLYRLDAVADGLRRTMCAFEDVAHVLETIVVKES